MSLKERISSLPNQSGVYMMKDKNNSIIYVGKAKNLKNRVSSYFIGNRHNEKTRHLVENIASFDYLITPSDVDAFVLENTLIKKYKPYYNILLKDGKTYPYIRIDLKNTFPKLDVVRKVKNDGAKYFGPYIGMSVRKLVDILNDAFKLRTCNGFSLTKRNRACIKYEIGKCSAPCIGKISAEDYMQNVLSAIEVLKGKTLNVKNIIKEKMFEASENENFERAIELRENIKVLEHLETYSLLDLKQNIEADIVGFYTLNDIVCVYMMYIRNGKMMGGENFILSSAIDNNSSAYVEFLTQFYFNNRYIPKNVYVNGVDEEIEVLNIALNEYSNRKINIIKPQKGKFAQLLENANNNAKDYIQKNIEKEKIKVERELGAIQYLKDILHLKSLPNRMECFDISNISGTDSVASMVVFINGVAQKSHYRKFNIKSISTPDDYQSMREVLTRRLNELETSTDISFSSKPDLIVIDGGKGQLHVVRDIFEERNIDIELISLAEKYEEIFTCFSNESVKLDKSNYALMLLIRLRDEAHRFAITTHRHKREEMQIKRAKKALKKIK